MSEPETFFFYISKLIMVLLFPVSPIHMSVTHHFLLNTMWRELIGQDRYLLCACQHGNTSSGGSTGIGSCGAGQSDTLCLTWEHDLKNNNTKSGSLFMKYVQWKKCSSLFPLWNHKITAIIQLGSHTQDFHWSSIHPITNLLRLRPTNYLVHFQIIIGIWILKN